jgi:ketosteroid isomerase-like protein
MRRFFFALAILVPVTAAALPPRLAALADAERAFAAAGARDGVQKAFLAWFADDAVALRPFATSATAWYRAHPDRPGKLLWAPQYLALSAAGDLGVSSGPWRFEGGQAGESTRAHGQFFSIWRHDSAHGWRVVFDHGVSHGAPEVALERAETIALTPDSPRSGSAATDEQERSLAAADDALRERLARDAPAAYARVARRQTLWLRDDQLPRQGSQPPPTDAHACGCGPRARLVLAANGDFGYTIGGREDAREKGVDVRVWQFDDAGHAWTVLADLAAAAP